MGYDGHRKEKPTISYQKAGYDISLCTDEKCPLFPFRFGKEIDRSGPQKESRDIPNRLASQAVETLIPA